MTRICLILILCFFTLLTVTPVSLCQFGTETSERENEDEPIPTYPEKIKTRQTWETIVDFPGWLIQMPFKLLFKGFEWLVPRFYVPGKVGFIYDFFTSDDGRRALRPTVSTRSGPGLKLYQKDLLNEGSKISMRGAAYIDGRRKAQLKCEHFSLFRDRLYTDISFAYWKRVNESFFGIGSDTYRTDRTSFMQEHTEAFFRLRFYPHPRFNIATAALIENNNIFDGTSDDYPGIYEVFDPGSIPGLENRIKLVRSGLSLHYDSRDAIGGALSGQLIDADVEFARQIDGRAYGFYKLGFDIRQYIHLFHHRRLVLRMAGENTQPLTDHRVPFYLLSELGRRETIRGYHRGRFRDLDMLLVSTEYHWPVWSRFDFHLDAYIFADAGQVADDLLRKTQFSNFRGSIGFGLRLWKPDEEVLNFIVSRSPEQFRFYLTAGI